MYRFLDLSRPYCIEPIAARSYLRICDAMFARKNSGLPLKPDDPEEAEKMLQQSPVYQGIKNLEKRGGERVQVGESSWGSPVMSNWTLRNGVATLPIVGPIIRYGDWFSAMSGVASTDQITADFNQALEHEEVEAILLNLDCPGGEGTSINELAQMIHSANDRKRIVAYGDGAVCSAAYWLASACDEIVLSTSGIAGSIGTLLGWYEDEKYLEMRGLEYIEFVSSQSPNKNPDPKSKRGKSQYQKLVDDWTAVFAADVARFRGVSIETVYTDYGAGGVFVGQSALDCGLVDRLGDYEALHAELETEVGKKRTRKTAPPATVVPVPQPINGNNVVSPDNSVTDPITISNSTQEVKPQNMDPELNEEPVATGDEASDEDEPETVDTVEESPESSADNDEGDDEDDEELISESLDATPENIARLQTRLAQQRTRLQTTRQSAKAQRLETEKNARTAFSNSMRQKVAPVARPAFNSLFSALQSGKATPAMLETALAAMPKNAAFEPVKTQLTAEEPPKPSNQASKDVEDATAYAKRRNKSKAQGDK